VYDFLQLMYQDGYLSSTELTALRKTCRDLRENPVRVLRSLNIVSQPEIQGLLQRFYGIPSATDVLIEKLDVSYSDLIPLDVALHYSAAPMGESEGGVDVLLEDPTDARTLHALRFLTGREIRAVVATAAQLARALQKVYGLEPSDLHLTTVLEASRGVDGGGLYEESQTRRFSKEKEFLLDDGTAQVSQMVSPKVLAPFPEHDFVENFGAAKEEEKSSVLAAQLLQDEFAPPEAAPSPSVFDEFEGLESVEKIDPQFLEDSRAIEELSGFEVTDESETPWQRNSPDKLTGAESKLPDKRLAEECRKLLVKLAMVRQQKDAITKIQLALANAGFQVEWEEEATSRNLRLTDGDFLTLSFSDMDSLSLLPSHWEPLKPVLRQFFRLPSGI
jgi:hypothetical protein